MKETLDYSSFSIEILIIIVIIILFDITNHILSHIFFNRINLKTNLIYYIEFFSRWDEISDKTKIYPKTKQLLYAIITLTLVNIIGLVYILNHLFK